MGRVRSRMSRRVDQYGPARQCDRMQPLVADWIKHIHLARQLTTPGERYSFFASVSRGEFVALFRGVYIRASLWNAMSWDPRYRARVKAASLDVPPDTVFSHSSAAALWRLPFVGPGSVHSFSGWCRSSGCCTAPNDASSGVSASYVDPPGRPDSRTRWDGGDARRLDGPESDSVQRRQGRSTGRVGEPRKHGVLGDLDAAIADCFGWSERSCLHGRLLVV